MTVGADPRGTQEPDAVNRIWEASLMQNHAFRDR
jgi:hypothetical protein